MVGNPKPLAIRTLIDLNPANRTHRHETAASGTRPLLSLRRNRLGSKSHATGSAVPGCFWVASKAFGADQARATEVANDLRAAVPTGMAISTHLPATRAASMNRGFKPNCKAIRNHRPTSALEFRADECAGFVLCMAIRTSKQAHRISRAEPVEPDCAGSSSADRPGYLKGRGALENVHQALSGVGNFQATWLVESHGACSAGEKGVLELLSAASYREKISEPGFSRGASAFATPWTRFAESSPG